MVKPIGNLLASKKPNDKVSAKTQARFASKALTLPKSDDGDKATAEPVAPKSRPVKFKKRKR